MRNATTTGAFKVATAITIDLLYLFFPLSTFPTLYVRNAAQHPSFFFVS